jgi:hypothetical protein
MSAVKDHFYRQILEALGEIAIDPRLFEDGMCDLLRDVFPGLVPVPGGSDAGFDGAIGDGKRIPYPLVCTTEADVIGNLTKSLKSYLRHGYERRKTALATSRALSAPQRRNLERRAREKGFTLVQIFDQRALADRLYHSPRWCRELLGLSGTIAALSPVPQSRRPQLELELVGREADVEWLLCTAGDRLISGEPGSGKTALVYQLVREGWGLFLNSTDRTEVAAALREQQPEVVLVDDAHNDLHLIEMLRHLRLEMGTEFAIVAISWEGGRERVAAALGDLPSSQMRRLELLTPTQIQEVIQQVGITEPDWLVRELIDQAARKPGLAVTLARLCLAGDWEHVVGGDALQKAWAVTLEDLVGKESTPLLAAISLGGDRGMPLATAGEFLEIGKLKAYELANGLAVAGVLSEPGEWTLAVLPHSLRSRLLCRFFFDGSASVFDYRPLLERVPILDSGVEAIIQAAHDGAGITNAQLQDLVARCRSQQVWHYFADLGESHAQWALEHFSGDWFVLARPALRHAPRVTIPRLLERSIGVTGLLETQIDHPLRLIKDWIEEYCISPEEALEQRRLVVQLATEYLQCGGDHCVGVRAFLLALSPLAERCELTPDRQRICTRWRPPGLRLIQNLVAIWTDNYHIIGEIDGSIWQHLRKMIGGLLVPKWSAYPEWRREAPRDVLLAMHAFAARVLKDLCPLAAHSPGLAAGIGRMAQRLSLDLHLQQDPVFELLYPYRRDAVPSDDLHSLAKQWVSEMKPRDVTRLLSWYADEAARIDHEGPHMILELSRYLSRETNHPEAWLQELLDEDAPADLLSGFLEQAVALRPVGWEQLVRECLDREPYAWQAVEIILCQYDIPSNVLERALASAARYPHLIETLCLQRRVPVSVLRKLLQQSAVEPALAAAVGEHHATPEGVRSELADAWQAAITRARNDVSSAVTQTLRYRLGVSSST